MGGVIGGEIGGVLGGQLGGTGVKALHWSQAKPKKKCIPKMPKAAKEANIEGNCKTRIFIGEDGKVYDYKFEACPKIFQETVAECMSKTTFYPAKDENGQTYKFQFVFNYKFVLKG